jgi:hypothetical protein
MRTARLHVLFGEEGQSRSEPLFRHLTDSPGNGREQGNRHQTHLAVLPSFGQRVAINALNARAATLHHQRLPHSVKACLDQDLSGTPSYSASRARTAVAAPRRLRADATGHRTCALRGPRGNATPSHCACSAANHYPKPARWNSKHAPFVSPTSREPLHPFGPESFALSGFRRAWLLERRRPGFPPAELQNPPPLLGRGRDPNHACLLRRPARELERSWSTSTAGAEFAFRLQCIHSSCSWESR